MHAFLYNHASKNFIFSFFVLFCLFLFVVFSLSPFSFFCFTPRDYPHLTPMTTTGPFVLVLRSLVLEFFHFLLFVRLLFD